MIRSIFTVFYVLLYSQLKKKGKFSWLIHLRHGDITNMEIYLSWGYNYTNHGDIIIEIFISWRYNYIMEI